MASSASDGALRPLQTAMQLANRAIQMDTGNRHREAYVGYLRSVNFISQVLAEEVELKVNDTLSADSQKMLKLAEQCLERARTTADKLGNVDVNLRSSKNEILEVHGPPPTTDVPGTASATTTATSATSRPSLGRVWGHRRACSDEVQKLGSFPSPEVFQMLRTAEAQSCRKELTPLEEASIQNQKLRAAYEVRLARLNPRQAAQKTSLTLSLQRKMMENLVIAKAREETLQRKAEERRLRLQEESNRHFSNGRQMTPQELQQKRLYTAVLEYEQDHEWPKLCKEKIQSNPSDPDLLSSYIYQILSTSEHPVAKLLIRLQCQIYRRLYQVISTDRTPETSDSKLCSRSLPITSVSLPAPSTSLMRPSQSLHSLPGTFQLSIQHSRSASEGLECWEHPWESQLDGGKENRDLESSYEDLEMLMSPTLLEDPATLQELTASQHLKVVVEEIHYATDLLLSSFFISLDLPSDAHVKDVCLECLEESFFPPLWPALLSLYRQVLFAEEQSLHQIMELYSTAGPSVVGVRQKLDHQDTKKLYRAAIEDLEQVCQQSTPQRKLDSILKTLRRICECTEENGASSGTVAMGADDLLPILAFVVLKSRMSHLVFECAALEEFIHEGSLIGEEGYCLTSLQSALAYLATLPVPPPPLTVEG
ncbi:VPS9 domain-containing protein 1 [Mixophyes fleayi]|uniref:VPS9 domain-containing protein 1 n=1 Tax=Mixophyes fleayi TaxID=3061075 RepID=UPI003F4D86AA